VLPFDGMVLLPVPTWSHPQSRCSSPLSFAKQTVPTSQSAPATRAPSRAPSYNNFHAAFNQEAASRNPAPPMISRRQFKIQAPPTRSFALSSPRTLAHISQPTIRVPPASANVLDAAFLPLPPTPTEPSLQMDESETRLLRRLRIDDIHAARRPAAPQPLPSPRLVDEPDASLMAFERPTIQPRPSLQQLLDAKSERASSAPLAMTAPARPRSSSRAPDRLQRRHAHSPVRQRPTRQPRR